VVGAVQVASRIPPTASVVKIRILARRRKSPIQAPSPWVVFSNVNNGLLARETHALAATAHAIGL